MNNKENINEKYWSKLNYTMDETIKNKVNLSKISFKEENYDFLIRKIYEKIIKFNENTMYSNICNYPYFKNESKLIFEPKVIPDSVLLNNEKLNCLEKNIPYYHQFKDLKLFFRLTKDGAHLRNLVDKQEKAENILLLVKDSKSNLFGVYINEQIKFSKSFYGTGESFLFSFYTGNELHIFPATLENENFIYFDYKILGFGCENDRFSLRLNEDLSKGYSGYTCTYRNRILNKSINEIDENEEFCIVEVEAMTFV